MIYRLLYTLLQVCWVVLLIPMLLVELVWWIITGYHCDLINRTSDWIEDLKR